ncbi:hypothetical protein Tco_1322640 [Tanacetum coccineum]
MGFNSVGGLTPNPTPSSNTNDGLEQWRGWYVNRDMKSNSGGGLGREAKWDFNDKRRFVDVVNGKHTSEEWDNMYKNVDAKNQKNSEANEMHMRVIQNAVELSR